MSQRARPSASRRDRGHVLTVRDSATNFPYWRLTDVDEAGRYHAEAFGNDAATTRSYFADRQTLKSLVTQREATVVQDLAYTYDARLNLASRTDALQPTHPTERFRYDGLERLKCAYFSLIEDPAAPCALSYDYKPDGSLSFKSDVGVLAYDDPLHPRTPP